MVVAGSELEGQIDVWALGATSSVGDGTLAKLTEILEGHGITLLPLDWTARPLPPMAVLLSETKGRDFGLVPPTPSKSRDIQEICQPA